MTDQVTARTKPVKLASPLPPETVSDHTAPPDGSPGEADNAGDLSGELTTAETATGEPLIDSEDLSAEEVRKRRRLFPSKLADKLRRIRKYHNLSQGTMLMIVNPYESEANRARIYQYENGLRVPSLVETSNYARFAGVTMEVLVHDDKDLPKQYKDI
ncbi:MAG TPA: helix-turn-helix transcriptional regulator [Pyrinomonadaceae bacterium]|nr:helix-turn-helix transcriptional regulator [Pyrinomonadaceae bacterium]